MGDTTIIMNILDNLQDDRIQTSQNHQVDLLIYRLVQIPRASRTNVHLDAGTYPAGGEEGVGVGLPGDGGGDVAVLGEGGERQVWSPHVPHVHRAVQHQRARRHLVPASATRRTQLINTS